MGHNLGVYVHWPFCRKKCPYCDFNSHVRRTPIDESVYIDAFLRDIKQDAVRIKSKPLSSIFFGGGTPSLMHPKTVQSVIDGLQNTFGFTNDIEITLEANPTSVESQKFADFKMAGVNRVSLGVQSLDDESLKVLGREHSAQEALDAVAIAQKYFSRWSFDMMYTRPHQTVSDWEKELKRAMAYIGGHVSLYQLTIEQGTDFQRKFERGELVLPNDDISVQMYTITAEYLNSLGYNGYEVSNYAKLGDESRHNLIYWQYQDYLGIGAGAHGRLSTIQGHKVALARHRTPERWVKNAEYAVDVRVSPYDQASEAVLMGLRLQQGICLHRIQSILGDNVDTVIDMNRVQVCMEQGLLEQQDAYLRTTHQGRLTLNSVLGYILH